MLVRAIADLLRWAMILLLTVMAVVIKLLSEMLRFLSMVCGIIARVAIVAGLVVSTLYAAVMMHRAYGSDLPALLPAVLLVVAMTALGFNALSWGALLAGGLTAYAIGTVIQSADIVTRSLIIVGALATTIAHNQFTGEREHENQEIEQRVYQPDQDRPDLLYDDPDGRSGDVDSAVQHQDLRRRRRLRTGYRP